MMSNTNKKESGATPLEGFTPGPWHITETSLGSTAIASNDDKGIVAVVAEWRKNHKDNARLIASAPTLYEENKRLKEALKEWHHWWCNNYADELDSGKPIAEKTEALLNSIVG